ncbi:E3 ubiquitin-protein ligase EL5-like [Panicum miliaceum]|uniref:E3 ubiquitin-protein ligase EL5-like n=1 Tax=Panicum miliaceum TaxID=4540 RepID=A0A3L6R1L7_PANMI|nr:E3 ubiquitin-protein ligase EL5-like [Panicum miliaceum]
MTPCDEGGVHFSPDGRPPRPPPAAAQRQAADQAVYAVTGRLLLATAGAFAGVLLALVALHLYNGSRRRRLLRSLAIAGAGEDRDGAAPSPRGLDPAVLAAIPVVAVGAGGDCVVCLAELEPGEKARSLPRCGHRFHVECIDAWFRGNATCPLCRADVVVVANAPSAPAEDGAPTEVRIDVAGDAAADASVAPPTMARLPSGTDLGKARQVFASARFAASF